MFLMYVDESGDSGLSGSPTRHFVLTGLVLHELRWRPYVDELLAFRGRMGERFGLRMREEIHAASLISRPGGLIRIPRHDRLAIIRAFADQLAAMNDLNLLCIVVDKSNKTPPYNVFSTAWTALIQRFENTLARRNFRGPTNPDERGMLFPDHTDDKKLVGLLRRMRRFNPIPHQPQFGAGYRDIPLTKIEEDPNFRESHESYFVQAADLAAFLLYQQHAPCRYVRAKNAQNYFRRLEPILCKVACTTDPLGVVRL